MSILLTDLDSNNTASGLLNKMILNKTSYLLFFAGIESGNNYVIFFHLFNFRVVTFTWWVQRYSGSGLQP